MKESIVESGYSKSSFKESHSISIECQKFIDLYQSLNEEKIHSLTNIYHPNITFIDPLHQINGLAELKAYFLESYSAVKSINFNIHRVMESQNEASVFWQMAFESKSLNKNNMIYVDGLSYLQFQYPVSTQVPLLAFENDNNQILHHRDYFDAGQMLYEHVPIMGKVIAYIKRRLGSK